MKQLARRRIVLWLGLMVVLTVVLGACTGGPEAEEVSDNPPESESQEESEPAGSEETSDSGASEETSDSGASEETSDSGVSEEATEAPQRKKLSLKIMMGSPGTVNLPADGTDFVRKRIEEKFNVELETINMPQNKEYVQKLSLLVTSGDAPDMFTVPGRDSVPLNEDGVLRDLSDVQNEEKMPNLYNWVDQGQIDRFQLAESYTRGVTPARKKYQFSYFIRKDWLDNLGMEMPTNYEELTEVMRAFSEDDPDGNGQDDTFGFSAPGNGDNVHYSFPQFKAHGLQASYFVDPETGDFRTIYTDPAVGDALDDLRVWIENDWVDPDWFLSEGGDVASKFAQGKVGMHWVLNVNKWAFDSQPDSHYNSLKERVPEAEYVPFNPYPGEPIWSEPQPWQAWHIFQKTPQEKVDRLAEILNWLYSEEGYLMTHYGLEGKHYTRDGNTITLKPDAIKTDIVDNGNFLLFWDALAPQEPSVYGLEVIDPRMTERDRAMVKKINEYPVAQGLGTNVSPPPDFDFSEFSKYRKANLANYLFEPEKHGSWEEMTHELMTKYGGNDLFNAYVEQMQAVGIEVNDWKNQ